MAAGESEVGASQPIRIDTFNDEKSASPAAHYIIHQRASVPDPFRLVEDMVVNEGSRVDSPPPTYREVEHHNQTRSLPESPVDESPFTRHDTLMPRLPIEKKADAKRQQLNIFVMLKDIIKNSSKLHTTRPVKKGNVSSEKSLQLVGERRPPAHSLTWNANEFAVGPNLHGMSQECLQELDSRPLPASIIHELDASPLPLLGFAAGSGGQSSLRRRASTGSAILNGQCGSSRDRRRTARSRTHRAKHGQDWHRLADKFPLERKGSTSSIMPTPERGLSVVRPIVNPICRPRMEPNDLNRRLKLLTEIPPMLNENVSPVNSDSPNRSLGADCVISPLNNQSPGPPPSTPTRDGLLQSLPRLNVPSPEGDHLSAGKISCLEIQRPELKCRKRSRFTEDCSPKEILSSTSREHSTNAKTTNSNISPRIVIDGISPGFSLSEEESVSTIGNVDTGKELSLGVSTYRLEGTHHANTHAIQVASSYRNVVESGNFTSAETFVTLPQVAKTAQTLRDQSSATPIAPLIRPTPTAISCVATFASAIMVSALSTVVQSSVWLQERYGPEPSIKAGHTRVRWTCTCGEQLYDDFIENRPGAAAELEYQLNGVPIQAPSSPFGSSNGTSSAGGSIFSRQQSNSTPISSTSWSSQGYSPSDGSKPSRYSPTVARSYHSYAGPPYIEPLYLLTCANHGKWTTKLSHLDVNSYRVSSDKDLATVLRKHHSRINRKWYKFLKLRGLVSIDFVQFEVHRNRYADIRASPAMPPSPGADYDFQPNELSPPVGSNYLMHLFQHPEDYDGELIAYLRAPKKRGRLDFGVGWGINLVEGFCPERVWALIVAFFVLGSLVFAVVWTCRRGEDIQGAFGVASWICTLAALAVGWAQACLG